VSGETRIDVEEIDEVEVGPVEEALDEAAYKLWRKAIKTGTWDPAEIDLSEDREQYEQLDEPTRIYLERFCSAFYNAEENVALLFCPWIMAASGLWQQAFLSTQLVEEFKHTDFFDRYFKEVFGEEKRQEALANPVHDTLQERGERLVSSLNGANEGERTRASSRVCRRIPATKSSLTSSRARVSCPDSPRASSRSSGTKDGTSASGCRCYETTRTRMSATPTASARCTRSTSPLSASVMARR
jgi:hypothetical protein